MLRDKQQLILYKQVNAYNLYPLGCATKPLKKQKDYYIATPYGHNLPCLAVSKFAWQLDRLTVQPSIHNMRINLITHVGISH